MLGARLDRVEMMLGDKINDVRKARVAVIGAGGVGCFALEMLARSGIEHITVMDDDIFTESNMNRQLYALYSTLGEYKVDVVKTRIKDINPDCEVTVYRERYTAATASMLDLTAFDYVIDAIDTVTDKVLLIRNCLEAHTYIISCMGTGNRLNPGDLRVADISETTVCPLAKAVRKLLREQGITSGVPTVYSSEEPVSSYTETVKSRHVPGSIFSVPATAGIMLAVEVVRQIVE